jgi:hypothetical protein
MTKTIKPKEKFRLEDHLLLARFMGNKLGIREISGLQDFRDVPEGTDTDGRSYMYSRIISRRGRFIDDSKLQAYDQNIRRHAESISRRRGEPISLKYYQYLALLYTEIYLDKYFQPGKEQVLLNEINKWLIENENEAFVKNWGKIDPETKRRQVPHLSRKDLQKLAYWMATGSGKTLIMHANLLQFLNYNKGDRQIKYDNIILVTSNDEMSRQHLDELRMSGIKAELFRGDNAGYFQGARETVKVISIHKLRLPEDKRGKVESIDISRFGTRNLVFVDEGHKGQKSEDQVWKRTREFLAKDGFTFEYSATFGQVITSEKAEGYNEYTKCIIFDYSYKYFNGDGYGKDFRVLNLDARQFAEEQTRTLLTADAVAYYEQLLLHRQLGVATKEYNIEKPLWVFVGSKVEGENSDIVKVADLLHSFLAKEEETKRIIGDLLAGRSGIIAEGKDVFTPTYPDCNFPYLRETKITADQAYEGILREVFHLQPGQGRSLQLVDLRNAEGEIALSAGASPWFFGVITVGDKPGLLNLLEKKKLEIQIRKGELGNSQFEEINRPGSGINVLIGAKKFIEGWNSWRVSNMCLLNVGKSEGPQIIQLFGRGVRLKGKGSSLKRSRFTDPPHPPHIEALETLHIYGVHANYMETFRQAIEQEDVPTIELNLPTRLIEPFPDDLQTLTVDENWRPEDTLFRLQVNDQIKVSLNLLPRAEVLDSREEDRLTAKVQYPHSPIPAEVLDLLDWNKIHHALLKYKAQRKLYNIAIDKETIKRIMYEGAYTLYCAENLINPKEFKQLQNVEEITVQILIKYLDRYYSTRSLAEERNHYQLKPLRSDDEKILQSYKVKVTEENRNLADYLQKIIEDKTIYDRKENRPPPDLRFHGAPITFRNALYKGHLFQPLLVKLENDNVVTIPTGLNEGETRFVEDLNRYLVSKQVAEGVYLLRNQTRGKGIGFFEYHSFYPDFIMWIVKNGKQTIVFIDPKGLIHLGLEDQKLNLHTHVKNEVLPALDNPAVKMDAFIVSRTPFIEAKKIHGNLSIEEYGERHLLFQELRPGEANTGYMGNLFNMVMGND